MFLEILKSPDKDFECTKLRSILKMLIVGIFLDINKYQKMWKHMVNWIKQSLEAIHICICKYNPISSWQSSKTNHAHCPVQDVTTKGLPSVSKLGLWQYNY